MDLEEYGQLGIHVVVYGIYENLRWKRQDKSFRGSAQRGLNLRKRRNGGKKRNVRNDAVDKRQARRFARDIARAHCLSWGRRECFQDRCSIPDPIQFFFVKCAARTRIINKDEHGGINVTDRLWRAGFLIFTQRRTAYIQLVNLTRCPRHTIDDSPRSRIWSVKRDFAKEEEYHPRRLLRR